MKGLLRMVDRLRPAFGKGPLRLLKPAFDAIDFFLFSIPLRTTTAPHVRDPISVKRYMSAVIVALFPCIGLSIYLFGWRVLAMIVVTYVVGLSIELLFAVLRKEEINEGFFVTGLLYPLILPPALPLWMVGVGIAFGVVIGKELFGGTGRNPFNPALVGRCFLLIGYPLAMSNTWVQPGWAWPGRLGQFSVDAVSAATPLAAAKQAQYADMGSLAIGNVMGSAGETSLIAIALGGILLLLMGVASWRTIVATLGSFAVLCGALAAAAPGTFDRGGMGPLGVAGWHLLAGGLLFGTVFMATDPVTGPFTRAGKWAYGILIGVATLLIRFLTGYVEGVMFAILLGNIAAPILDEVAVRAHLRSLRDEG